jgi:hypothetical protein
VAAWTDEELERLRLLWPEEADVEKVFATFSDRKPRSVRSKAGLLGLKRPRDCDRRGWDQIWNVPSSSWAWLAGFVDGEGCLAIRKRKGKTAAPLLQVTNTHLPALIAVEDLIQSGHVYRVETEEAKKTSYVYILTARRPLEAVLQRFSRYLRVKHRQAELLLDFIRRLRDRTLTADAEAEFVAKAAELNRKGLQPSVEEQHAKEFDDYRNRQPLRHQTRPELR